MAERYKEQAKGGRGGWGPWTNKSDGKIEEDLTSRALAAMTPRGGSGAFIPTDPRPATSTFIGQIRALSLSKSPVVGESCLKIINEKIRHNIC